MGAMATAGLGALTSGGGMAIAGLGSVVSGGLGFLGSQNQANASREASNQQAQVQAQALQAQMIQNQRNQENIAPYLATGSGAAGQLTNRLTELTSPILMDQASLEKTPGYQFTLNQGLKATQSGAAARGLGVSGAALKGASNYATGLADNTYKTQFDIANTNQSNAFNRLYQTSALGQNAAVGAGTLGQSNANSQSNILGNMGTTAAQGILGSAAANNQGLNSLAGGMNNLASMYMMNNLLNRNGGGGLFGSGGSEWTPEMQNSLTWGPS
jgi:hypothetical protein